MNPSQQTAIRAACTRTLTLIQGTCIPIVWMYESGNAHNGLVGFQENIGLDQHCYMDVHGRTPCCLCTCTIMRSRNAHAPVSLTTHVYNTIPPSTIGPPGTGKTKCSVRIIQCWVRQRLHQTPILACRSSPARRAFILRRHVIHGPDRCLPKRLTHYSRHSQQ